MKHTTQNPVIISNIENFLIRQIATNVFKKLEKGNHPLCKYTWGDNLFFFENIKDHFKKWYPIGIVQTKQDKTYISIPYEIARRSSRHKGKKETKGLILNIVFYDEKYFNKFRTKYFDKEKEKKKYKIGEWDGFSRIILQIKDKISYNEIAYNEVDLLYINIKKFYDDWNSHIEEFLLAENLIIQPSNFQTPKFPNPKIPKTPISQTTPLKIKSLEIANFINFANTKQEFSSAINLFIGDNNLGKTTFIKFLYVHLKTIQVFNLENRIYPLNFRTELGLKILKTFPVGEGIGTIVNYKTKDALRSECRINFNNNDEKIKFSFKSTAMRDFNEFNTVETNIFDDNETKLPSVVFIPAKEILSLHKVLQETKKRVAGFDDTFYDLNDSIVRAELHENEFENIINQISEIIEGKIIYDSKLREFIYINNEGHKFKMSMTAEGVKQLGMLYVLLKNGEIHKNSVLFLDEPDNNLNPKATRKLVNILIDLSKAGIQIFVASHNYFFVNSFELQSRKNKELQINCYNLTKDNEKQRTKITNYDLKQGLPPQNLILKESLKMYDEEVGL